MRKLFIAVIVLLMTSGAYAGTVDVVISSLNGQPITPVKEITLMMGDTIILDVVYDGPQGWFVWHLGKEMVFKGSGELGNLDISSVTWPAGYWNRDLSKITATANGVLFDTYAEDIGTVPPGVILDHFQFQYWSQDIVKITLVEVGTSFETEGTELFELRSGSGVTVNHTQTQLNCYYCPGQPYGDTNGDGAINAADYFNFKKSYNTSSATHPHGTGEGQYNCCCDFNRDLKVSASDYFTFKKNFGKTGLGTCSDTFCP